MQATQFRPFALFLLRPGAVNRLGKFPPATDVECSIPEGRPACRWRPSITLPSQQKPLLGILRERKGSIAQLCNEDKPLDGSKQNLARRYGHANWRKMKSVGLGYGHGLRTRRPTLALQLLGLGRSRNRLSTTWQIGCRGKNSCRDFGRPCLRQSTNIPPDGRLPSRRTYSLVTTKEKFSGIVSFLNEG